MKNLIIILFLTLIIGCEVRERGVEVIPDYDAIYLPPSKVDIPVEILGDEDKQLEDIQNIIGEHYKPQNQAFYFFKAKLYVDENGELNKIQYSKVEPYRQFEDSDINPEVDGLFPKLTSYLEKVKFTPALLADKRVKSQLIWEAAFRTNNEGKADFYFGALEMTGLSGLAKFNSEKYNEKVDEMPFPVGGISAIAKNVIYPSEAKEAGVEGRVFVKAFIDEDGDVAATEIIRGIGHGCDEAAKKAVQNTKFKPGIKNGKPAKSQISIPIFFKLQ